LKRRILTAALGGGLGAAACGFEGSALVRVAMGDAGEAAGSPADAALDGTTAADAAEAAPSLVAGYAISAGQSSTCALRLGQVFCWGAGTQGQLGTGDTSNRSAPAPAQTTATFATIEVGDVHACAIATAAAGISCWGGDAYGQLGVGDFTGRLVPSLVALPRAARALAAGYEFTCAVLFDDSLWCWGQNDEGQLGQGDQPGAPSASVPLPTGAGAKWGAVAAGQGHACGIQASGSLLCWGRNSDGELGIGPGAPIQVRTPTRVGSDESWASLDLGQDATCAVKNDGTLWCWGADTFGKLGIAVDPNAAPPRFLVPMQVGSDADWAEVSVDVFHTCAVKQGGTLWCWGRNAEGQLGVGDITDRATPTQVGSASDWSSVSVGRFHTCAEETDHTVRCTGENVAGQLGTGDTARRNTFTVVVSRLP
jgi:alpha-tubulin suppressor-like RCC1 family protein